MAPPSGNSQTNIQMDNQNKDAIQQRPGRQWFDDKSIRNDFTSKVFAILTCQLACTITVIIVFMTTKVLRDFCRNDKNATICLAVFGVATLVFFFVLTCFQDARRRFPVNFILLALFTIFESLTLAIVSCSYSVSAVVIAFGATAIITVIISIWSRCSSFDSTRYGYLICYLSLIYILIAVVGVSIMAIVNPALLKSQAVQVGLGLLGGLLGSIYLFYDMQLILGGRHIEMNEEEHIYAAMTLFSDIIQIFLSILQIIGPDSS